MLKTLKKLLFGANKNEKADCEYRCINCGSNVKDLYKKYSSTIQKLAECVGFIYYVSFVIFLFLMLIITTILQDNCHEIADKYIEFEILVIIVDLILLSTQAQRHVLYNTNCKCLYKLLMVITLLESYCVFVKTIEKIPFENDGDITHNTQADPLFMEKGFYISTIQIALGKFEVLISVSVLSTI